MRPEVEGLAQAAALTIARVRTVALIGLDVADVDVEVQLSAGLPSFTIVGLADKAVAESRERVRAALAAMGLALPPKRITVNLAPADIAKEGSHFDLPIALGLLVIMGVLPADAVEGHLALGPAPLGVALPHFAWIVVASTGVWRVAGRTP
jgi:magnesium chelatase family protein